MPRTHSSFVGTNSSAHEHLICDMAMSNPKSCKISKNASFSPSKKNRNLHQSFTWLELLGEDYRISKSTVCDIVKTKASVTRTIRGRVHTASYSELSNLGIVTKLQCEH